MLANASSEVLLFALVPGPAAERNEEEPEVVQDLEALVQLVLAFAEGCPVTAKVHPLDHRGVGEVGHVEEAGVERAAGVVPVEADAEDSVAAGFHVIDETRDFEFANLQRRGGVRQVEGEQGVGLLEGDRVCVRAIEAHALERLGPRQRHLEASQGRDVVGRVDLEGLDARRGCPRPAGLADDPQNTFVLVHLPPALDASDDGKTDSCAQRARRVADVDDLDG